MEYASNGKGNLGVVLGAIGTGASLLSNGNGGSILGNILGNGNTNYVTKENFDLQLQLINSQKDNAVLSSDLTTERKMNELYATFTDKIANTREELYGQIRTVDKQVNDNAAAQAVINCGFNSANAVLQSQMAQLMGLTKLSIPNSSLAPGYGNVTITPTTSTTTTT